MYKITNIVKNICKELKKMSKRAYIFCLIIFIFGFSVAYVAGIKEGLDEQPITNEKAVNVNPDKATTADETEGYWVKAVNDVIFVYKSDKTTMIAETDINISELSAREKNVLTDGIYLENAEELFKYLEANTS